MILTTSKALKNIYLLFVNVLDLRCVTLMPYLDFFLPLMHELDTNVFVKNKCIRGKNIQFFLSDNLLFQLSFPRRRESHVKAYGLLWDSRLRGNDMVRQFEIHPAKPPARIF
jgi:hypothetical protein